MKIDDSEESHDLKNKKNKQQKNSDEYQIAPLKKKISKDDKNSPLVKDRIKSSSSLKNDYFDNYSRDYLNGNGKSRGFYGRTEHYKNRDEEGSDE